MENTVYTELVAAKKQVRTTKLVILVLTLIICFVPPLISGLFSTWLIGHGNCSMAKSIGKIPTGTNSLGQASFFDANDDQIREFCSNVYMSSFLIFALPVGLFSTAAGICLRLWVFNVAIKEAKQRENNADSAVRTFEAELTQM